MRTVLVCALATSAAFCASTLQAQGKPQADAASARTFVIHFSTRDLAEFEKVAALAQVLKRHGRVEMVVSTLAEKSAYDIPKGGSPWHEYAAFVSAPYKFFPPKILAPYIPAAHVAKNRAALMRRVGILRRFGYAAAFYTAEPNFLPEAFYEKYPHLRGARSDHPRRSRKEAFSPCVDRPEVRAMIAESMEALVRAVPELHSYQVKTNDAGPGLCWSYWLYSGPNGPAACKDVNVGVRVRGMFDAMNAGAQRAGGKLDITFSGLFHDEDEQPLIREHLPPNVTFGRSRARVGIGTGVTGTYPVKGVFNPLALLRATGRLSRPGVKTVAISFRVSYDRGGELPETVAKVFDIVDDALRRPVSGEEATLARLREYCVKWGGAKHADILLGALVALDETMRFRRQKPLSGFSSLYGCVSVRWITRPLVAMPDKLTPDEEAYFLPYVFNPHVNEARMDTIDIHGKRLNLGPVAEGADPRFDAVDEYRKRVDSVARVLEHLDGAPEEEFFRGVARSLRITASFVRSANNFYAMQIVRDRNKEKLTGAPRIPPKTPTRTGDPDLLLMDRYMRDELDNAAELIDLLEAGGIRRLTLAKTPAEEDTFVLGPDLVAQLKRKRTIMRRHWLDASRYMTTPFK